MGWVGRGWDGVDSFPISFLILCTKRMGWDGMGWDEPGREGWGGVVVSRDGLGGAGWGCVGRVDLFPVSMVYACQMQSST